jgi:hypothetical protein
MDLEKQMNILAKASLIIFGLLLWCIIGLNEENQELKKELFKTKQHEVDKR